MKWKSHSSMKESGHQWIGPIPTHWEIQRIGKFFSERREKVSDRDFPPLSVTKNGVVPQLEHAAKSDDGDNRKRVAIGDFVINGRSDRKGSSGVSNLDGSVSLINLVLKPKGIAPAFIHYLFRSDPFKEEFYRWGNGIVADLWSTGFSEMKVIQMPVPPAMEQDLIASYLDHEIPKIEALINEQRNLIERLREKRLAVIHNAVTKGLSPGCRMRESGKDWIGSVPAHWDVLKIKYVAKINSGHTPSRQNPSWWIPDECTIPWVSLNDTKALAENDFISDTQIKISPLGMQNSSAHLIEAGAVVMNRDGARVGLTAITTVPMCVSQHMIAWVCSPKIQNEFLLYVLYAMNDELYRIAWGSTIPTIGMNDVFQLSTPVPPIEEQRSIISTLRGELKTLDNLILETQASIALLQEHRSALITAVVTGKVDVRKAIS